MPKPKYFHIHGAEGTAQQLYDELAPGLENPPTFSAFVTRLKRGEINKVELCRSNKTYSSAGMLAKINGGRKGGLAKKNKKIKPTNSKVMTCLKKPLKLVFGKVYFRPGSLDAWPGLKELEK